MTTIAQTRIPQTRIPQLFKAAAACVLAVSALALAGLGPAIVAAQHLESVLNTAANINYASGASRARFLQVRGVGDLEQFLDPKHFPAVGIRIDDIDLGSAANAAMLFDQEQVEFLRGPQGTEFGTSALAGLVNIRGRRPTDTFEGYGRIGYGNYGSWHAGGAVSGPLGESAKGRLAVRGRWQVGATTSLEAVATHLQSDLEYGYDEDWTFEGICDGMPLCFPFSNTDNYLRDRGETSFDVRLLGDLGSRTQYVLGVYAQSRDEDLHREHYGDFFSGYATDRRAVYGQLETAINDRLALTAGLRFEDFSDGYSDTNAFESSTDDSFGSGELTLSYQATQGAFVYATLARGNKAGAVNTAASSNLPLMQPQFQDFMQPRLIVGTETILNRELGIKGSWLEARLALRAAVFHMRRDNAQLESWMWDGVNFLWIGFLDHVDGANWGAEVELDYRLTERARLFASLGRLQSSVDEITTFDLDAGDFVVRNDIDQAKSPRWQYHLGTSFAIADRVTARVEFEGRDDSRFGYYHLAEIGGYGLLNASLRYSVGRTELQLWGRNLADEDYAVHGLYFGNDPRKGWINETFYQYGEPRVLGVTARYSFQ